MITFLSLLSSSSFRCCKKNLWSLVSVVRDDEFGDEILPLPLFFTAALPTPHAGTEEEEEREEEEREEREDRRRLPFLLLV